MKKYFLLLVLITISSCSNEDSDTKLKKTLEGKWNWNGSSGGFTGTSSTPESTGRIIYIEFSGSTYRNYINGKLLFEKKFEIKTRKSILGGQRPMIVSTDTLQYFIPMSFTIENDELFLSDECFDCFGSGYTRMK
ncbi:hypothetical protein NJT12_22080 [Flavobacterium sp. AC]|uniref:Lipocalin-like domain-containing protein n=1 Tax=Flavobacterium azizsancarii TaxID=2961580 RepID=A0ABT4WIF3_9FLAO|nr:hypothetical protein [Flavobacterium azizsancarii]MDA6072321.1 hypothetical protein [Flavobacterium azizsancarii]